MIGAEVQGKDRVYPAANQQYLSARIADVIEVCCDEWLDDSNGDDWQMGPMTAKFWVKSAERLVIHSQYWRNYVPTAVEVYKIAMSYTARWDPKGRGASEESSEWGFNLGSLTWGKRKAEIDVDLLAKPWYVFASNPHFLEQLATSPVCGYSRSQQLSLTL